MTFKRSALNYIVWGLFCISLFAGIGVSAIGFSEKAGNASYLVYVGLFYALFVIAVTAILLGYKPVRNNLADRLEAERKRIGGVLETILVFVVVILAIIVRFGITLLMMDSRTSVVFAGTGAYFEYAIGNISSLGTGANIAFVFTELLKGLFSLFGKTFISVYVMQSVFTVGILLLLFYSLKDLAGRFIAWISLILFAFLPGSVYLFMECSPGLFYAFLLSVYLFAAVKIYKGLLQRKFIKPKHFIWFGALGLYAGLLSYLDISGVVLIPVTVYGIFMLRRKRGRKAPENPFYQSLVFFIMAAATLVVTLFGFPAGMDAGVSGIARFTSSFIPREGMNLTILTPHYRSWDSLLLLVFAGLWMIVFLRIRKDLAFAFSFMAIALTAFTMFTMDHTDYTAVISICYIVIGAIGLRNIGKMYAPAEAEVKEETVFIEEEELPVKTDDAEEKESVTTIAKEKVKEKEKDTAKLSKEEKKLAKMEKKARKKGVILLGKHDSAFEEEASVSESASLTLAEEAKSEEQIKPAKKDVPEGSGVLAKDVTEPVNEAAVETASETIVEAVSETASAEVPEAAPVVAATAAAEAATDIAESEAEPETRVVSDTAPIEVPEDIPAAEEIDVPAVPEPVSEVLPEEVMEPASKAVSDTAPIEVPEDILVVEEPVVPAVEEPVISVAEEPVISVVEEPAVPAVEEPVAPAVEEPVAPAVPETASETLPAETKESKKEEETPASATTTEEKKETKRELPPYVPQKMILRSRGKMFTPVKKAEVQLENDPELLTKPMTQSAMTHTAEIPAVNITEEITKPALVESPAVTEPAVVEPVAVSEPATVAQPSAEEKAVSAILPVTEEKPAEVTPAKDEKTETISPAVAEKPIEKPVEKLPSEEKKEEVKKSEAVAEEKKSFIKNPLPGPKPHVSRELVFDYELKDDEWDYDLKDISGKDFYDI